LQIQFASSFKLDKLTKKVLKMHDLKLYIFIRV